MTDERPNVIDGIEYDARDIEAALRELTPGTWEVSYGEPWSGGDLAIMAPNMRTIATLVRHEDEAERQDVVNAELLVRAPELLRLVARLALFDFFDDEPEDFDALQTDAIKLLNELTDAWKGEE